MYVISIILSDGNLYSYSEFELGNNKINYLLLMPHSNNGKLNFFKQNYLKTIDNRKKNF